MKHLWESDHPYHCKLENYFCNDTVKDYLSWKDFLEKEGDLDFDLNLVFRWDWHTPDLDDDPEDLEYLDIFFICQRKGLFRSARISISKEQEEDVIKYLKPRWKHLQELWSPIWEPLC